MLAALLSQTRAEVLLTIQPSNVGFGGPMRAATRAGWRAVVKGGILLVMVMR